MIKFIFLLFLIIYQPAFASDSKDAELIQNAQEIYNATQIVCHGISDKIGKIANISTVNTAITGVGTLASGGALIAGIQKSAEEQEIERLINEMCKNNGCSAESIKNMTDEDFLNKILKPFARISELQEHIDKSKQLGNWRTGLMAGTIGTNLASVIISSRNTNQSDLIQQISACNDMTIAASDAEHKLMAAGINPNNTPILKKLNNIKTWCSQLNIDDIQKIEKRMKGVMGTSIAGGAIGIVGTATSAVANSDKYSDTSNRITLSDQEKQHRKNLNTTANIMAGAGVATGATGTVLNISLITLAQKLIKTAQRCEEVLQ